MFKILSSERNRKLIKCKSENDSQTEHTHPYIKSASLEPNIFSAGRSCYFNTKLACKKED